MRMIMYASGERTNRKGGGGGGGRGGSELEEEGERNEMASIPLCVSLMSREGPMVWDGLCRRG